MTPESRDAALAEYEASIPAAPDPDRARADGAAIAVELRLIARDKLAAEEEADAG